MKVNTTYSIIGGADGPTSIFLAGSLGDVISFLLLIGVLGILIGVVIMKFRHKK